MATTPGIAWWAGTSLKTFEWGPHEKKEPSDEKDYPEPLRMKEGLSLTLFSWGTGCSPMGGRRRPQGTVT